MYVYKYYIYQLFPKNYIVYISVHYENENIVLK